MQVAVYIYQEEATVQCNSTLSRSWSFKKKNIWIATKYSRLLLHIYYIVIVVFVICAFECICAPSASLKRTVCPKKIFPRSKMKKREDGHPRRRRLSATIQSRRSTSYRSTVSFFSWNQIWSQLTNYYSHDENSTMDENKHEVMELVSGSKLNCRYC